MSLAEPTWKAFALLHGWEVRALREHPAGSVSREEAKAFKLTAIEQALREANLVLWLDADAMIVDPSVDIAGFLYATDFQGLVLEHFATRFNPNTGVWLLRSEPETFRFLDAVRAAVVPERYVWVDQARVMKALGWQLEPMPHGVKPVHPSQFLARTGWLAPEWNVISEKQMINLNAPTRIRHFAGRPQRREHMAEQLSELVRLTTVHPDLLDDSAYAAVAAQLGW
jgi:hypothetical protein